MILVKNKEVKIERFPDGTPRINFNPITAIANGNIIVIDWRYDGMDELFYLGAIKKHIEKHLSKEFKVYLQMPYIPNARMDRSKNVDEVFTLKYFCDFINSLNFDGVYVLDAHSYVSAALLNHCRNRNPYRYIYSVLNSFGFINNPILYFPDAGSCKRYIDLFTDKPYCYGEKQRDWKTGKITGLEIRKNGVDLTGKTIIMIDDICSYGGTFKYSAEALKQCGCGDIYAFATHTEDSVLDKEKGTFIKLLENNTVERLFTTNSLFRGEHEKIYVMEVGSLL